MVRRFVFIGVTTRASSMMAIFPCWRDALGLGADVELEGWDLPVDAPPERYRAAVERLRRDPHVVGALVTTPTPHASGSSASRRSRHGSPPTAPT